MLGTHQNDIRKDINVIITINKRKELYIDDGHYEDETENTEDDQVNTVSFADHLLCKLVQWAIQGQEAYQTDCLCTCAMWECKVRCVEEKGGA